MEPALPLETATYISDLVQSNPAASDGMNNADDHMRLIKGSLKNSFPNITGAMTATQTDLNAVTSIVANGVAVLADAGVYFKTNTTDGFVNTLAGDIDIKLSGVAAGSFQRTAGVSFFKWHGPAVFDAEIKGPGITPVGSCVMWFDDTLPTDGLWAWANGQVIASAATVCPILLSRWGNRFGGNGVTTMGVPDLREVVPVGKSTMGATTARGTLTQFLSAALNTIGGWFGESLHTLTIAELASHYHVALISDNGHTHGMNTGAVRDGGAVGAGGGPNGTVSVSGTLPTMSSATTGVRVNSANGLDTTASQGGGSAHNNVQPSVVVNWIIRIG